MSSEPPRTKRTASRYPHCARSARGRQRGEAHAGPVGAAPGSGRFIGEVGELAAGEATDGRAEIERRPRHVFGMSAGMAIEEQAGEQDGPAASSRA
jgi:hypothetical protein